VAVGAQWPSEFLYSFVVCVRGEVCELEFNVVKNLDMKITKILNSFQ
jgi:hypothetical protein